MNDFKLESETKIKAGFTVPEGYFDTFSQLVIEQLPEPKLRIVSLFRASQIWYYSAAAVILIAISIPLLKTSDTPFEQVDPITLENYIVNQSSIGEEEIAEVMANENIEMLPIDFLLSEKELKETLEITPNIEQYLID
jgi:hypothetical protein